MTRIITFADGFSSATAPSTGGTFQAQYTLTNNQASAATILTLDPTAVKTHFYEMEIERLGSLEYRQSITAVLTYNGSWELNLGSWQGDEIVLDALDNTYNITLTISGNNLQYTSGNLSGHTLSKIKINDTGILA